ncbi:hypothetical protein AK830_g7110 [Neonectria ditissima]|uniref:Mid2 domain-containing protein n=1 Tax=Neonectria ditissima TaxID=78410 RepID=A0A0P7BGM6_9HYPO|nr:hypothetical protein AK830_g7110 [Neonectria ditissima]
MKVSSSYAAIAALSATTNAMQLIRSEPTVAVALADDGVSPRPTEAPKYDLFRRADNGTMLYAPDNTCGYISGRQGAGYTCFGSATCAFSVSDDEGHVACCDNGECNMRFSCVDSVGYFSKSECGDGCEVDALTLKCTASSAPYCNTISFSGGVTDYWCNNLNASTAQVASTTYAGGDDREYTTLDESSSSATLVTSGSVSEKPTVTVSAKASSTSSSDSESSSSDSGGGGGSKTPVGPIVGGVVGGIGGLALIGAAIFFFLRNKKKKSAAAAANNNATVPPTYQPPPMQQQPGTGPNGYNPVPQGQAGYYDPKNPYSTPGQQYNQPVAGGGFYPVQNQAGTPDFNQTNPSSPGTYDPRMSQVGSNTSPSPSYNQQNMGGQQGFQPGYQPQQTVIHEAPTNAIGSNGRDDTHELA